MADNPLDEPSGKLTDTDDADNNNNNGLGEREDANKAANRPDQDECTIYKFPWAVALLWCLGVLCLALLISQCIMCSSLVCKCVKTEVEEREPSVFEGAEDSCDEDKIYNKKHPYRIDYDNRDIYKTTNNYDQYALDQAAESDVAVGRDEETTRAKSRPKHRRANR